MKIKGRYIFSGRGVATAIGNLRASCNSHQRVREEELASTGSDLRAI